MELWRLESPYIDSKSIRPISTPPSADVRRHQHPKRAAACCLAAPGRRPAVQISHPQGVQSWRCSLHCIRMFWVPTGRIFRFTLELPCTGWADYVTLSHVVSLCRTHGARTTRLNWDQCSNVRSSSKGVIYIYIYMYICIWTKSRDAAVARSSSFLGQLFGCCFVQL